MRNIGIDIDKETNEIEGYLQMEFDARKKFDKSQEYRVFATYPEYIRKEIGCKKNYLIVDTWVSWNELIEVYESEKESLDNFAETNRIVETKKPDHYDLLNLASDINSYMGLP